MIFNIKLVKTSLINWYRNDPFSHSAAIAFYTIFSFPALLLIYLNIASMFSNKEYVHKQIITYLQNIVGNDKIHNIESIIDNTSPDYSSPHAAIIGAIILLFAGLKLFLQLQKTLNIIWEVKVSKYTSIISLARQRMISLAVMLSIGFIILVSLIGTTLLTILGNWISASISEDLLVFIHIANFIFSFFIISTLFTVLLKLLPDVDIPWKFAFTGGSISALLHIIGQYGLSFYFKIAQPDSAYGVTGSIILLMLWVSYSCVIFLYGAEVTKVILEYNKMAPAKTTDLSVRADTQKIA